MYPGEALDILELMLSSFLGHFSLRVFLQGSPVSMSARPHMLLHGERLGEAAVSPEKQTLSGGFHSISLSGQRTRKWEGCSCCTGVPCFPFFKEMASRRHLHFTQSGFFRY